MSVEGLLIALLKVEQRKKSEKISRKTRKKYQKEQENKQRAKELKNIHLNKKTEHFLEKIEEKLNRLKKHCNRDKNDLDYKGIRYIENLFGEVDEEDYYKPIKTKDPFNDNQIEYERRGDKNKNLSLEEYFDMIRPYLRDMINIHKTPIKLRYPLGKIIDNGSFGEWKIQ